MSSRNAPELARRAAAEGVAMLTVHGRTRCQFYRGAADWAAIRAVVAAVDVPVVANGDCASAADARAMLAASGAAAVMVGRAAVGRPWLAGAIGRALARGGEAEAPPAAARAQAALAHYESILSALGVAHGVRHARKHLAGYAADAGVPPADARHRALVTSDDPAFVRRRLGDLFTEATMEMAA